MTYTFVSFRLQNVCFGVIDCTGDVSLFQALSKSFASVFVPALKDYDGWGELSKSPQGIAIKEDFMKYADGFVEYLDCKYYFILTSV